MHAAVDARAGSNLRILAVTVLTGHAGFWLIAVWYGRGGGELSKPTVQPAAWENPMSIRASTFGWGHWRFIQ